MHIKYRRNQALLYRSTWVPKGRSGNTHGYGQQRYVGCLPITADQVPPSLQPKLSPEELAVVEAKVCGPARLRAAEAELAAEQRERDPVWRMEEAARLLGEAAERGAAQATSATALDAVVRAVAGLGEVSAKVEQSVHPVDPLDSALRAIRSAVQAVACGHYGHAPAEGVRTTRPYKVWSELLEAVQGETEGSLLRALQERGFVKRKGR